MNIRDRFKVGDILRVVASNPTYNITSRRYVKVGNRFYYANRKAIVIGYTSKCTFTIQNLKDECAVALGDKGEIFIIHDNLTWQVVDHVEMEEFLTQSFLKE